jgi:hypothetical protein
MKNVHRCNNMRWFNYLMTLGFFNDDTIELIVKSPAIYRVLSSCITF